MESLTINKSISEYVHKVFDEEINLTGVTEYGISWENLLNRSVSIPPQGARFDLAFEGQIFGDIINGTIKGTDHLEVRADGKFILNIYATFITEDGEIIAVKESGVSTPNVNGTAVLHLIMEFFTVSQKYEWINKKVVWSVGVVDMIAGKVKVTGYIN
ncbi:MAG: DUF3237 family protein [Ignavibacteriaceae bacterium]